MKVKKTVIILLIAGISLFASCAMTAEETPHEKAYYEEKYAEEPAPSALVSELLAFLDTCVGGQYIYGGQGNRITHMYVDSTYEKYPDYFSDGRLDYFSAIAGECLVEQIWDFPEDYAWDCSGLWWYCCNELGLYEEYTDRTANDTFDEFCTVILKEDLRPGDLVFIEDMTGRIIHMGIVGQKGYIYEAVSGFAGVVKKRTVDKRVYDDIVRGGVIVFPDWNVFGRPKIFE